MAKRKTARKVHGFDYMGYEETILDLVKKLGGTRPAFQKFTKILKFNHEKKKPTLPAFRQKVSRLRRQEGKKLVKSSPNPSAPPAKEAKKNITGPSEPKTSSERTLRISIVLHDYHVQFGDVSACAKEVLVTIDLT